MTGKKIRMYREFRGINQIELAERSGINVGTIRKYETGVRNPKPDQLEKIANALGLNVSVFFDFNLETAGDIMSLLFAIDNAVNIRFSDQTDKKGKKNNISLQFEKPALQSFLKEWAEFKCALEKSNAEALAEPNEETRKEMLAQNAAMYEEWKLRTMGTGTYSNMVVTKETKGIVIKNPFADNEE